jgi:hypothetical protein
MKTSIWANLEESFHQDKYGSQNIQKSSSLNEDSKKISLPPAVPDKFQNKKIKVGQKNKYNAYNTRAANSSTPISHKNK